MSLLTPSDRSSAETRPSEAERKQTNHVVIFWPTTRLSWCFIVTAVPQLLRAGIVVERGRASKMHEKETRTCRNFEPIPMCFGVFLFQSVTSQYSKEHFLILPQCRIGEAWKDKKTLYYRHFAVKRLDGPPWSFGRVTTRLLMWLPVSYDPRGPRFRL